MSLRTAGDVYTDYSGRRRGIVRALTTDVRAAPRPPPCRPAAAAASPRRLPLPPPQVEELFKRCDPAAPDLCLSAAPDGSWSVGPPAAEVPPELPEPALGINAAREGMDRGQWLALVAVHSDAWLMAVAFFNAARLDAEARRRLFNDINALPTCLEVATGRGAPGGAPPAGGVGVGKRAAAEAPAAAAAPVAAAE
jgi:hypothetical protein